MNLAKRIFVLALGLSLACLVMAFVEMKGWIQVLVGLLIGIQWGMLVWNGRRALSLSFLGLFILVVDGAVLNSSPGWLLGSLVMLLVAWDLSEFVENLAKFAPEQINAGLIWNHIRRLFYVAGAGLGLGALAIIIKVRLDFGISVLLGVIVFVGLAGAVRYLRGSL